MASHNLELIPQYKKKISSNFEYYSKRTFIDACNKVEPGDNWATKARFETERKQRKREHEIEHGFIYIRWGIFDPLTNRALSAGTVNVSSPLFPRITGGRTL